MAKLVLYLPDGSLHDIPLDKERLTIGRRPDNDISLPYPAVSGEHAAVVTILADSFLEDLGSTNGTLVNGKAVVKHFLRDNDHIDIGRQRLVYFSDDDAQAIPLLPDALRHEVRGLHEQVERVRERRAEERRPAKAVPSAPADAGEPGVDDDLFADIESSAREDAGSDDASLQDAPRDVAPPEHPARDAAAGDASARDGAASDRAARPDASPPDVGAGDDARARGAPAGAGARSPRGAPPPPRTRSKRDPSSVATRLASTWSPGADAPEAAAGRAHPAGVARGGASGVSAASAGDADPLLLLYRVRVLSGPSEGREVVLNQPQVLVGRVGTEVARLAAHGGGWQLSALEGTAPLQVNGRDVPADGLALAPGDRFRVAGADLVFEQRQN